MPVELSEEPVSPAARGALASSSASPTVSRALRLIEEGVLDHSNIDALCERLGIGARQLRRLFNKHVGASPVQVALVRRAQFARRLIETTSLSMSNIAKAAGFGSVRRFNAVINEVYGCSPSALRKEPAKESAKLELHVAVEQAFPWERMLQVIEPWTVPGVEQVIGDRYCRTASFGGCAGEVSVTHVREAGALRVRVSRSLASHLLDVVSSVRRLFDLDADTSAIAERLEGDERLRRYMSLTPGLRVPGAFDHFETAVMMLLNQNTSPGDASDLMDRIVDKFGKRVQTSQLSLTHVFPTPAALAGAKVESVGVPTRRARSIQQLAKAVHEGSLRLDGAASLDSAVENLRTVADVSATTAHHIAMRVYREADAFPSANPWLRQAMSADSAPLSAAELEAHAESWRPYRAYAAMHLWASLLSDEPDARELWRRVSASSSSQSTNRVA
jgi:AraC family transcriptional regulator of adaptative response / DNA-3-methyladenine glycosylase II